MEVYTESFELNLHEIDYLINVEANDECVTVEAEEKSTGMIWRAYNLSLEYIENITKKTGHFKRFYVFCRMLRNAFKQTSETVFVDLLNPKDIQTWKQQLQGGAAKATPEPKFTQSQLNAK